MKSISTMAAHNKPDNNLNISADVNQTNIKNDDITKNTSNNNETSNINTKEEQSKDDLFNQMFLQDSIEILDVKEKIDN